MSSFDDWYVTKITTYVFSSKADENLAREAYIAGMERAAVIAEKSIQHVFVNKRHIADVDGRIPAEAIRKEIDNEQL